MFAEDFKGVGQMKYPTRTTSPFLKEIHLGYGMYTTIIPRRSSVRIRKLKRIKLVYDAEDSLGE